VPRVTVFSPDGAWLAQACKSSGGRLWHLRGPAFAEPVRLRLKASHLGQVAFTQDGRWLASTAFDEEHDRLAVWRLSHRLPRVLSPGEGAVRPIVRFHPDGSSLLTVVSEDDGLDTLLSWPLGGGAGREPTVLFRGLELEVSEIAGHPGREFVVAGTYDGGTHRIPLDGGVPARLEGVHRHGMALDPMGRFLVSRSLLVSRQESVSVLDLETGKLLAPEVPGEGPVRGAVFDARGRLVVTRGGVLSRWNPSSRATELLVGEGVPWASPIGDGQRLYVRDGHGRSILDLEDGSRRALPEAHQPPGTISFDPTGSIVATAHPDGEIRVGRLFDDEPHLLLGHGIGDTWARLGPRGQWVASLRMGGTLRLWPMPDLSEPPFHTLPHDELMTTLEALTNLRAVPDERAPTGYRIEADPNAYHGWQSGPEW
jgi:WD40 repeat protein